MRAVPRAPLNKALDVSMMKLFKMAAFLLVAASEAAACMPSPPPVGVHRREATPEEAQALVPFVVIGTASGDSVENPQSRGFRFAVEQWIKGTGPNVLHVRGQLFTRHSKMVSSCDHELPLNKRVVLLLTAVEPDGNAFAIHRYDYLDQTNLFLSPVMDPRHLGL